MASDQLKERNDQQPKAGVLGRARAWLVAHWEDADATSEEASLHREQQLGSVMRGMPVAMASNALCMIVVGVIDWREPNHGFLLAWLACGVAAILWNLREWQKYRRRSTAGISPAEVTRFASSITVMSGTLACYLAHRFVHADANVRLFLGCLVIGFMSNGSLVLALLPQAGLLWVSTFAFISAIALLLQGQALFAGLALMILWYGGALAHNVLSTSKIFLRGLRSQVEIERQKQVVGLLLNDFESSASDWLWETNAEGELQHASVRLCELTAKPASALLNRSFLNVLRSPFKRMSREEHEAFVALETLLSNQLAFRNTLVPALIDGEVHWWSLNAKPLLDTKGGFLGFRGVGSDITTARKRDLELYRLANVDTLTQVANRRRFQDTLDKLFASPDAVECTVFLLDLDHFKTVNDSLGHSVGDELLSQVASRLLTRVHEADLLARLGGDEFAVIASRAITQVDASEYAAALLGALATPFLVAGQRLEAYASIGVSQASSSCSSSADLLKQSDMALYAAKAAGRRTMKVYGSAMGEAARAKSELARAMKEGLVQNQFTLHYQPQVDTHTGALVGFEALVRWQHPTRGLVPPLDFIPLAEETGFIVELGAWVIREACKAASQWPSPLSVAVNLSALQFGSADLLDTVVRALEESGVDPERLELELTESALVDDHIRATHILGELRARRVRIALDDFGTGFSSLSYLRSLPLDKLKIDRSFVSRLDDDLQAESVKMVAIVQAIVDLARALSLETTAEGVETEAQRDVLRAMGCHHVQGWLTGKPMAERATPECIERLSLH
jgi:diguanylate cyclase (GGDEF)-like protein